MYIHALAQGCNDAGFCSVGDMNAAQRIDSGNTQIGFTPSFRLGEKETLFFTNQLQAAFQPIRKGRLELAIPYHFIAGKLAFVQGIGDITPAYTHTLHQGEQSKLSLSIAAKIPLNDAGIEEKGEPLPMAYQTSQGTWDGIIGLNYFKGLWHYSLAFQHNFNANNNGYIDGLRSPGHNVHYFDSRKIDRGDDVLIRLERIFRQHGKNRFFLSLLPIYRIQEATIENTANERIAVSGSSGLTVNINAGYLTEIGKKGNMRLMLGAPAITRHVRPDGLTGTFVVSMSINWAI